MDWNVANTISRQLTKLAEGQFDEFPIVCAFHAGEEAIEALWEDQPLQKHKIRNWAVRLVESGSFWTPDVMTRPGLVIRDEKLGVSWKVLFAQGRYICDYDGNIHRIDGANNLYLLYLRKQHFTLDKQNPFGVIL
jgi:hypothetical protein